MKPSSTTSRVFYCLTFAAVFLALAGSPIIKSGDGSGCTCAIEDVSHSGDSHTVPAGCCAREGLPAPASGDRFLGIDTIHAGGEQPVCCHAVPDPSPATAAPVFLQDNRRPLFPDLPFQQLLSSTVMFPPDRHILPCVSAFDRDMIRISLHISSTVFLL